MPPRRVRPATLGSGGNAPALRTLEEAVTPGDEVVTPEAWLSRVVGVGTLAARHIMSFFERVDLRTLAEVQNGMTKCAKDALAGDEEELESVLRVTDVFDVLVARCSLYNCLFKVFALLSGLLRRALDAPA